MLERNRRALLLGAVAPTAFFASVLAGPASAQAPSAPQSTAASASSQESSTLSEVVVTARRTEEKQQSVPIAITAFSQDMLNERGIQTGTDLQNFTPSLSVVGHVSRNDESYTLRGIGGNGGAGTGSGPGVVAYFAEVPSSASGPGRFYDLQSLQVLKGPQGTLFGRNTTGGAVLLEPVRPRMNTLDGYGELNLGNYARVASQGAVNLPVIQDKLAVRFAFRTENQDGYVKDAVSGRDYLNRNNYSLRLGVQFNPTDYLKNYTAIEYIRVDENGGGNVLTAVNPARTYASLLAPYLAAQQARGVGAISLSTPTKDIGRNLLVLNSTEWRASDVLTFKNILAWNHHQSNTASDGDGSPLPIADLLGAYPGGYNNNLGTLTEEFQGRFDNGTLRVQAGVFYLNDTTQAPLTFRTINPLQYGIISGGPIVLPTAPYLLPLQFNQPRAEVHGESKAAYVQASYKILPTLTATAGYRHTWDTFGGHIESYINPSQLAVLPTLFGASGAGLQALGSNLCVYDVYLGAYKYNPNCTYVGFSGKSDGDTWQAGLDWQADASTLIYGVTRRGYKSGGFNPVVLLLSTTADPLFNFKPEEVTDIEIGLKRDWRFGPVRARTNIDYFRTWYNNVQVNQRAVFYGSDILTNAKSAEIDGIEAEGSIIPVQGVTLSGTYSWNNARYTDYHSLPLAAVNGNPAVPSQDLSDTPFVYVPEHKFSIDGRFAIPIPANLGDLAFRATYSWQSKELVAVDPQPFDTIPSYGLLNLRLEWTNVRGLPLDLTVYGNNVTDVEYRVAANMGYNTSGWNSQIYGMPAEFGATLRYRF